MNAKKLKQIRRRVKLQAFAGNPRHFADDPAALFHVANADRAVLLAEVDRFREALQSISLTIEQNNEQGGFWGVAGAHGTIRMKCIDALEWTK